MNKTDWVDVLANVCFCFCATAAYDEDDDGFTFSRTRSKKITKKTAVAEPEPAPPASPAKVAKTTSKTAKAMEEQTHADQSAKSTARRTRKSAVAAIAPAVADEMGAAPKRRRSARLSGGSNDTHMQQQQQQVATPAPEKPKRARKSIVHKDNTKTPRKDDDDVVAMVGGEADKAEADQPSREGTKIALPFADTPIIKRNKEMRKGGGGGHRRSSTGLRGRRASSLIDSGTSNGGQHFPDQPGDTTGDFLDNQADTAGGVAVPHAEVQAEEFYKHIEQSLPEPRRMKQLLTWCGTRALPDKPAGEVKDSSAILAG